MSKLKLILSGLIIALPLAAVSVLTGCASVTSHPVVGSRQCANDCDNKITQSILNRLQADSRVNSLPISVSTCNHIVRLRGTVYNDAQLQTVLSIASHTAGVKLVSNGILVRDPFVNH